MSNFTPFVNQRRIPRTIVRDARTGLYHDTSCRGCGGTGRRAGSECWCVSAYPYDPEVR